MDQWKNFKQIEIPEEALKQTLEYDDSLSTRVSALAKRSPFLIAGVLSFTAVAGIGIYKWRTRKIPASLFIIQLRVAAQSAAIGCLSIGMIYHMFTDYILKKDDK